MRSSWDTTTDLIFDQLRSGDSLAKGRKVNQGARQWTRGGKWPGCFLGTGFIARPPEPLTSWPRYPPLGSPAHAASGVRAPGSRLLLQRRRLSTASNSAAGPAVVRAIALG